jgi:hypothetical protein
MASKKKSTRNMNVAAGWPAHQAPDVNALIPEIRSDVKWRPTANAPAPFVVPGTTAPVLAVWHFGLPFKDMDGLHTWLRLNEMALAGLLKSIMDARSASDPKVYYLGTYLNIDAGKPMYQTCWAYSSEQALETESAWPNPIPPQIRNLVVELRAFWVKDPGRSEARYGLASNYANLATMPDNPVMLQVTIDAAKKP